MLEPDDFIVVVLSDTELAALDRPLPRPPPPWPAPRHRAPMPSVHCPMDAPWRRLGRGPPSIHVDPDNVTLHRSRDADNDLVVSFASGAEYVACVVIQSAGKNAFMSGLWTHPAYRRRGLARALMAVVLSDADRRGTRLRLRVNSFGEGGPGLAVLERFYASFGFERVPGEDLDGLPWERRPAGSVAEVVSP